MKLTIAIVLLAVSLVASQAPSPSSPSQSERDVIPGLAMDAPGNYIIFFFKFFIFE
jgi:hypothetical protein